MDHGLRDSGRLRLDGGKTRIDDADGKAMGSMKLEDGIAYSRNIIAAKVAIGLAPDDGRGVVDPLRGLEPARLRARRPASTSSGEIRGLVNDPAITPWREIDLANGSFGQGVAVTQIQLATAYAAFVNGGMLVKPHVVAGVGPTTVEATHDAPVLDPGLSPQLAGLMEHVLDSPWYAEKAHVPGYWVGGKTGTAQVWDAEQNRWAPNTYNFSCVGFIGRQEGHPDLIVAVRIREAQPAPERAGPAGPPDRLHGAVPPRCDRRGDHAGPPAGARRRSTTPRGGPVTSSMWRASEPMPEPVPHFDA